MGLLGPKPCASGGKGNGLNGTFGRGGGDRTHEPSQDPAADLECFRCLDLPHNGNLFSPIKSDGAGEILQC